MDQRLVKHFEKYPLKVTELRLTGMSLLIDKNNETLSSDMMTGLIFALVVVAAIIGFLFKSIRVAIISLVPNLLPLMVMGGYMGLVGIDLKISTSVIFGIAFGIAVDDSIHYLIKYRQELKKGKSNLYALKRTSLSTGKAIILTSIILCMGFISLSASEFTSTYYVGVLISMALTTAVIADLILLPILLLNRKK
jgi:predicted RND superfamily exporter protein